MKPQDNSNNDLNNGSPESEPRNPQSLNSSTPQQTDYPAPNNVTAVNVYPTPTDNNVQGVTVQGGVQLSSTQQPTYSTNGGENAKISHPRYWLTVLGIIAILTLLGFIGKQFKITAVTSWISLIIWLVTLTICYKTVTKLKTTGRDDLDKPNKYKMVLFMAVDPIIAQAFYYYRLRKNHSNLAKLVNKIGWKVLGLDILFLILFGLPLSFALSRTSQAQVNWLNQNESSLKTTWNSINSDMTNLNNAEHSNNTSAMTAACQQLKADAASILQLPTYPTDTAQQDFSGGATTMQQGATDCISAVGQNSGSLFTQAVQEINSGHSQVYKGIQLVTSPQNNTIQLFW
jgi:hypothetical protein